LRGLVTDAKAAFAALRGDRVKGIMDTDRSGKLSPTELLKLKDFEVGPTIKVTVALLKRVQVSVTG